LQDGGEMPLGWLRLLIPGAQACDRSQACKAGRESKQVGSAPGKMLDHARELGSADQPLSVNCLCRSCGSSTPEPDFWRGCKDRRRGDRQLAVAQSPVSQWLIVLFEVAQQRVALACSSWWIRLANRFRIPSALA